MKINFGFLFIAILITGCATDGNIDTSMNDPLNPLNPISPVNPSSPILPTAPFSPLNPNNPFIKR